MILLQMECNCGLRFATIQALRVVFALLWTILEGSLQHLCKPDHFSFAKACLPRLTGGQQFLGLLNDRKSVSCCGPSKPTSSMRKSNSPKRPRRFTDNRICTYVYKIYICVYIYTYMYINSLYIHMYIYIHMYTYT